MEIGKIIAYLIMAIISVPILFIVSAVIWMTIEPFTPSEKKRKKETEEFHRKHKKEYVPCRVCGNKIYRYLERLPGYVCIECGVMYMECKNLIGKYVLKDNSNAEES